MSGGPCQFGADPKERLHIAVWERRAKMTRFNPSVEYGRHSHPMFTALMTQFPDYAVSLLSKVRTAADIFADQLDRIRYVAGKRFMAAELTAVLVYFGLIT